VIHPPENPRKKLTMTKTTLVSKTHPSIRLLAAAGLALVVSLSGCGDDGGDGGGGATPRGAGNPPALGPQIDRAGRAAISTALVETFNPDDTAKGDAKDDYNEDGNPGGWVAAWSGPFTGSLAILDSLDGMCGNQLLAGDEAVQGRYDALAGILADDRLLVNAASGDCGVYLGLEGELVGALDEGDGGCGGRTPDDDVIERSYSVLAAGVLTGVDDTIAEDARSHSATDFPFLAGPN